MLSSFNELEAALRKALGQQRAEAAIRQAATTLSIAGPQLTQEQALAILGVVAEHDGLVGISARFARSRMMTALASADLDALRRSSD